MKRVLASFLLLVIPACNDSTRAGLSGSPSIVIRPKLASAGRILATTENRNITAKFEICNTGNSPLIIEGVDASCGCSSVSVSRHLIPAGEFAQLVAAIRLDSKAGQYSTAIRVLSNDPKRPYATVSAAWEIIDEIAIIPDSISLSQESDLVSLLSGQADIIANIPISSTGLKVAVIPIHGNHHAVQVQQLDIDCNDVALRPGQTRLGTLKFTVDSKTCGPSGEAWFEIKLAGPLSRQLKLPVYWTTNRSVRVTPNSFYAGIVSPGIKHSARILLRMPRDRARLFPDNVSTKNASFTKQGEKGGIVLLNVDFLVPDQIGVFREVVEVPGLGSDGQIIFSGLVEVR